MADVALEALWKHVLERWQDQRTHGAFLEYCRTTEQLAEAAARYRGMKGDRDRSQVAEKRLASVTMIALSELERTRSKPPRAQRSAGSLILAAAFGLAAIGLLTYLMAAH